MHNPRKYNNRRNFMKKGMVGLSLFFLLLVFAASSTHAEMCGCMDHTEKGFRGAGMAVMGGSDHGFMEMRGTEHGMWRHLLRLGLDDKQKEAIKDISSRTMKDTIRKRADLLIAALELREILHKDTVDLSAAEAKLKQMESLRTDLRLSHIKAMEEIKANLTPDQRKKLKEDMRKNRRGGRGCIEKKKSHEGKERMQHKQDQTKQK
jgi:Spy/CpxP family protein refolding chaperone